MAIVFNDPNAFDLSGQVGEKIGDSLAQSMNIFTQKKMQEIQQRQAMRQFIAMGYHPQEAQALTYFKNNPKQLAEMMGTFGLPGQNEGIAPDQLSSYYQQMGTGLQQQQPSMAASMQNQFTPEQIYALQQQGAMPQSQAQQMMARQQQPQQPQQVPQQRGSYQPVYQAPTPGYQQPGQVPGRRYSPTANAATEKLQQARQKQIDANTKAFNDQIDKAADESLEMKLKAQEALDLIAKGTTRSGVTGLLPLGITMANSDTRVLDKIYAELQASVAAKGTGPLSRARIKLAERQKPTLDMPVEGQKELLQRIIDQADNRGLALENIRDRIVAQNGGNRPANLRQLVLDEWRNNYLDKEGAEGAQAQQDRANAPRQDSNLIEWAARQGISGGANVLAGAIGGLGNIAGAGVGALNYVTGGKIPALEKIQSYLPTSQNIADKIGDITGGYTKPQGTGEEFVGNALQTFGSLFGAGALSGKLISGLTKRGISEATAGKASRVLLPLSGITVMPGKALAASFAGEAGKEAIKNFGGGPIPQTIAQLAFMHTVANPSTRTILKREAEGLYNNVESTLKGVRVPTSPIMGTMTRIDNQFKRQVFAHSDQLKELMGEIKEGLKTTTNGKIEVNDLIKLDKNLNARFGWALSPRMPGDKGFWPKELIEPLGRIQKQVRSAIARGTDKHPQALVDLMKAKDIWTGISAQSKITKWLNKNSDIAHIVNSQHTHPVTLLFHLMKGTALKTTSGLTNIYDMFKKYPPARKIWADAWKAALKENKAALLQSLAKMDKLAKKSQ